MQVRRMINHIVLSGIYHTLPPTWKNRLKYLEEHLTTFDRSSLHIMNGKHDPALLLSRMADANDDCNNIDASFKRINQLLVRITTTNITVSNPLFSPHERATRLKAAYWAITTSELSARADNTPKHLDSIATGPFLVIVDQTVSLALTLLVTYAPAAQPPCTPTPMGIKAFLGFPPPTVTPAAGKKVIFSTALNVVADTGRYARHLLRSVDDAAIAKVAELQRVLEAGLWVSTRVVTYEQWRRREEEMWEWLLGLREGVRESGDYGWWHVDCENYEKLDKRVKVSYVEEDE